MESDSQLQLYDDFSVAKRLKEATGTERGPVKTILFEARNIAMGGIDLLRSHPVGSIEVGSVIAATGIALGAGIVPRPRHAH